MRYSIAESPKVPVMDAVMHAVVHFHANVVNLPINERKMSPIFNRPNNFQSRGMFANLSEQMELLTLLKLVMASMMLAKLAIMPTATKNS